MVEVKEYTKVLKDGTIRKVKKIKPAKGSTITLQDLMDSMIKYK